MKNPNETIHDMVRRVTRRRQMRAEDCDRILWGATCFPFGDARLTIKQLRQAWGKGRKSVDGAVAWSEVELERAMATLRTMESVA